MKIKYNLVRRLDPTSESKEMKWYAVPVSSGSLTMDETAQIAMNNTSLINEDFKYVMNASVDNLLPAILFGRSVTLGKWGKFRLSFGSEGVDDIDEFDPERMIKNIKLVQTPSVDLKQMIQDVTFELEGIVEDGIKYGSKESYLRAKGTLGQQAIVSIEDIKTGKKDGSLTRGNVAVLYGNGIYCMDEDGQPGGAIKLYLETDPDEPNTTITQFAVNEPGRVVFAIPNDLIESKFTLTLETYYMMTGEVSPDLIVLQCPVEIQTL